MKFMEIEKTILRMRLVEGQTLREVGARLHITRERIQQVEARALRKMWIACKTSCEPAQRKILAEMFLSCVQGG